MTVSAAGPFLAAGALLGALHFAILWASVRILLRRRAPWFFALAALARFALVLAGVAFALTRGATAPELAAAGFGFLAARLAATRLANRVGTAP